MFFRKWLLTKLRIGVKITLKRLNNIFRRDYNEVFKEDEETYILQITDANGTYLTPNLKGEDGEFAGKKIDENLEKYRLVNPVTLNVSQRNSAFLYVRRSDENEGTKVSLNTLALKEEVDEQISRKIRTEKDRAKASWQVGDYIFLEKN